MLRNGEEVGEICQVGTAKLHKYSLNPSLPDSNVKTRKLGNNLRISANPLAAPIRGSWTANPCRTCLTVNSEANSLHSLSS